MQIHIDPFLDKYRSIIPESLFVSLLQKHMRGIVACDMPDATIERLERKLTKQKEAENRLNNCVDRNNRGSELERAGEIERAIALYEENISDGYPATHSFDRLLVIYRRNKDYKNERRVIKRACSIFKSHDGLHAKYVARLDKVEQLIKKS